MSKQNIRTNEDLRQAVIDEHVSEEEKKQALATCIYNTTKKHSFFGSVLQCMNITYTHRLPTAGVSFDSDLRSWNLWINPKFFCKDLKNDDERMGVLLHELYHIIHKHPFRIPMLHLSKHKRQLFNVAADGSINQLIKGLPEDCINILDVEKFHDVDDNEVKTAWKPMMTSEYYYEKLLQMFKEPENCAMCGGTGEMNQQQGEGEQDDQQDNNGSGQESGNGDGESDSSDTGNNGKVQSQARPCPNCSGTGKSKSQGKAGGGADHESIPETIDVHDWDGSAEEKDMLDATEDLMKRAMIKRCSSYSDIPGAVKDLLDHIKMRRAELDYKSLILMAMRASLPANKRVNSWTRKSRRYGFQSPGMKYGEEAKLDLYLDTSGSISVEELNEFLIIVDELLRVGAKKCRLNFFHTDVYLTIDHKLGDRVSRDQIEQGGTDVGPVLESIAKKRPDLAVIVTDGYYSDFNENTLVGNGNKFPKTIFVISKDGDDKHPFAKRDWSHTVRVPSARRD